MTKNDEILATAVVQALSGKGAHVESRGVFEGLDWKLSGIRPAGTPHTLFQLLNHLVYWQNWVVKWLEGNAPLVPKHASGSWPGSAEPASRKEWADAVRAFSQGLDALDRGSRTADLLAKRGRKCRLEMLQTIASHNSYHLGQAALLRQMLGAWPPPTGGLTW
jgi:uncharacterized damage-inducible protein DinB